MPSKYTPEVVNFAKSLYLQGETLNRVAEMVRERAGGSCSPVLIHRWAKKGNWLEAKNEMLEKVSAEIVATTGQRLIERQQRHLEMYQDLAEQGYRHLEDEMVIPESVSDVVNMMDKGIKGERQVSAGIVAIRYIEEVVRIILEEVQDTDTRVRLSRRLQKLAEEILS